jgi:excisionase family DNA binding protein
MSRARPLDINVLAPVLATPRRGLSMDEAARYIGVGTTTFLDMVEKGRMPKPREINSRRVWDIRELDIAFDRLPGGSAAANPWDAIR